MLRNDLTDHDNATEYLGSFWSQIFENGVFGGAIGGYFSNRLAQLFSDLKASISGGSLNEAQINRKVNAYPIVISRKQLEDRLEELIVGRTDNIVGGSSSELALSVGSKKQSRHKFFCRPQLDARVDINSIILLSSAVYDASVVLTLGNDFFIERDKIVFYKNPFDINGIKKTIIVGDSGEDESITLWAIDASHDTLDIYRNFGNIFLDHKQSSELLRETIKAFFQLLSGGPSHNNIKFFMYAITGSQYTKSNELVESIFENDIGTVVITDHSVYQLRKTETPHKGVYVGAMLPAYSPLTTCVDVVDPNTNSGWWRKTSAISGKKIFCLAPDGFLSFENKTSELKLGSISKAGADGYKTKMSFSILGDEDSKNLFWQTINLNNLNNPHDTAGYILSDTLVSADHNGNKTINPAQFISSVALSNCVLPIFIDVGQVEDVFFFSDALRSAMDPIASMFPSYLLTMVFLSLPVSELAYTTNESIDETLELNRRSSSYIPIESERLRHQYDLAQNNVAIESAFAKYRTKCSL